MREAHAHLYSLGQSLEIPSLGACGSVGECLEAIRREAEACRTRDGARAFVRLHSARPTGWAEQRWPTLAELDRACGGAPCVVFSFDHHAAAANTAALEAAGLKPGTPVPPNGVVVSDASGQATGLLMEQAAYRAWEAAPEPGPERLSGYVAAALSHLQGLGFDEVHDLHSQPWLGSVLAGLERSGRLNHRVWMYPNVRDLADVAGRRREFESRRVRLAGGKMFADGTLNQRTALMIHRYCEPLADMPRGKAMMSPAAIEEGIRLADGLGLPVAVHAIGDGAVKMVLDCFERSKPRTTGQRIEHCELVDRSDVGRFVKLGVTCSVQPCHLLADVEALQRFVSHRLDRVLPLRELLASGLAPGAMGLDGQPGLVFGSDVPIVRADPGDSVRAAVHRRREGAAEEEAIAADQAISEAQAWACFGR